MPSPRRLLFAAILALVPVVLAAEEPAAPPPENYFADWAFSWGTDTTFTAASNDGPETNTNNFRTSPFDPLSLRLYGRLRLEEKAELVVDLASNASDNPRVYGLYATLRPVDWLGIRAGLMPLVFGGWQPRAYPDKNPLIGAPLPDYHLLDLRSDMVPADADELVSQRGKGVETHYSIGLPGVGHSLGLVYETCWDTGVELFGDVGPLGWHAALMQGTPGSREIKDSNSEKSFEARLTWKFGAVGKIGASWAKGAYLDERLEPMLPAGTSIADIRQEMVGADARLAVGPVELNAEWTRGDHDTPFVADRLRVDGSYAEAAWTIVPSLVLAGRWSEERFSKVTVSTGERIGWDADATRYEAGLWWRFFDQHAALKLDHQWTRVETDPEGIQKIWALQLAIHY